MYLNVAPITYSIPQVIEMLNLSRASVYAEINDQRLRTYKVGRRRMVSHGALEDWIKAREEESNEVA